MIILPLEFFFARILMKISPDDGHLFASKYMTYMPTPDQLRAEIERQKTIFYLQMQEHGNET